MHSCGSGPLTQRTGILKDRLSVQWRTWAASGSLSRTLCNQFLCRIWTNWTVPRRENYVKRSNTLRTTDINTTKFQIGVVGSTNEPSMKRPCRQQQQRFLYFIQRRCVPLVRKTSPTPNYSWATCFEHVLHYLLLLSHHSVILIV
jgi:hypothetical protein